MEQTRSQEGSQAFTCPKCKWVWQSPLLSEGMYRCTYCNERLVPATPGVTGRQHVDKWSEEVKLVEIDHGTITTWQIETEITLRPGDRIYQSEDELLIWRTRDP